MSNLHRIIWIDEKLKNNYYPCRSDIVNKFEISIRQAARDIEYMKDTLGAPIKYCSFKRGYYYPEGNSFILPSQYINENERNILKNLASQYANYGGEQATQISKLFKRLTYGKKDDKELLRDVPIFNEDENRDDDTISCFRDPFTTIVKIEDDRLIKKINHPFKKINNEEYVINFYQSEKLIKELLATFNDFTIISPNWLREKLIKRLNMLININKFL